FLYTLRAHHRRVQPRDPLSGRYSARDGTVSSPGPRSGADVVASSSVPGWSASQQLVYSVDQFSTGGCRGWHLPRDGIEVATTGGDSRRRVRAAGGRDGWPLHDGHVSTWANNPWTTAPDRESLGVALHYHLLRPRRMGRSHRLPQHSGREIGVLPKQRAVAPRTRGTGPRWAEGRCGWRLTLNHLLTGRIDRPDRPSR